MRNTLSTNSSDSCQVLLEETLHKTTETLGKTESVLEATRLRLAQVETAAAGLEKSDALVDSLREELGRVTAEKESLSVMLSKEMAAREMHQQERAGLVSRYGMGWVFFNIAVVTTDLFITCFF